MAKHFGPVSKTAKWQNILVKYIKQQNGKHFGQLSKTAKWQNILVKLAKQQIAKILVKLAKQQNGKRHCSSQQNNMIFRSNDQINTTAFILTFYLQKTSKFRFDSKKFISGKKFDFLNFANFAEKINVC